MEPYKYFGLNAPPFDGRPDPRFYYAAPSHAEALATLQYTIHAGKTCTLLLGDSGSGKTLLARLLVGALAGRAGVGWVHGIGQPDQRTDLIICPPNRRAGDPFNQPGLRHTSLSEWMHSDPTATQLSLVVVDNADALRPIHWQDVLSLVTREVRTLRPLSIVLLGLPSLMDTLEAPALVRLQRRLFRTCHLARLSPQDVAGYVRHRLKVAGAGEREIFTAAALDLLHRFSDGNPALLNQLCDNTLVDAFSEDRAVIDARHVLATVQTITGGVRKRRYLPSPAVVRRTSPLIPMECRSEARLVRLDAQEPPGEIIMDAAGDHAAPPPNTTEDPLPEPERPLDERLRALEARLAEALARVREARHRPSLGPPRTVRAVDLSDATGEQCATPLTTPTVLEDAAS